MASTNQNSPYRDNPSPPIDMDALRRFGRWWEARAAERMEEKEQRSDLRDDRDVA